MKKLLIIAAAALLAAACAKTYEVKETTPPAIGFGTWSETLTKAVDAPTNPRVQGTSYFRQGDGIVVYGSKSISSTPTVVFNGVDVVATAETGDPAAASTWDYNGHRFWDANADSYTFFAVSPKEKLATTTTTATDGAFTTSALSFTGAANDFLVANRVTVEKGTGASNTYFNNYGTVALHFNHAASLVDIKVKKAPSLNEAVVKVSAFALGNINKTGVLTIASADYSSPVSATSPIIEDKPVITVAKWAASNPGTYLPAECVPAVYGDVNTSSAIAVGNEKVIVTDTGFNATNTTANTEPANSTVLFNNLVVVPQTFNAPTDRTNPDNANNSTAQKITLTYTITPDGGDTQTFSSTVWLYDFDSIDNGAQAADYIGSWEPGKHYIFYLTIDASNEIKFSANITDWTSTVNGYHYLVN